MCELPGDESKEDLRVSCPGFGFREDMSQERPDLSRVHRVSAEQAWSGSALPNPGDPVLWMEGQGSCDFLGLRHALLNNGKSISSCGLLAPCTCAGTGTHGGSGMNLPAYGERQGKHTHHKS